MSAAGPKFLSAVIEIHDDAYLVDDLWASPASRDAFMAGYRNTPWHAVNIDPAQRGLGPIGHMGYFRRKSEPLWRDVLAWFGEHEPVPGAVRGSGL